MEFYQYFEHTGIYDADGNPRAATTVWKDTFNLPISRTITGIDPISMSSPSGNVTATVEVSPAGNLYYSLTRDNNTVLEQSRLGLIVDGVDLGSSVINIGTTTVTNTFETYPVIGDHAFATNHYNESTLSIRRSGAGDSVWEVIFRLFDDGLAFQYIVPGHAERIINGETTNWNLPSGSNVWFQTETGNYEGEYYNVFMGLIGDDIGGPLTAVLPDTHGYLLLTEADLRNYSGMTYKAELGSFVLKTAFLDDESWNVPGGSHSPWRVAVTTSDLNALVNSDMVLNLSSPPDSSLFPDGPACDWIRPGRAMWSSKTGPH